MESTNQTVQCCSDCGRPLQTIWDYPANELWCTHCGNRYYATFPAADGDPTDPLVGIRLLLLDGESERRDYLASHFTRLGYRVTPVGHPRQALEAASFRRFELAVMPAQLPEFDCGSFVDKLRYLLGQVRVVLVVDNSEDAPELTSPNLDCVRIGSESYEQLEKAVELLVDELISEQRRSQLRDKDTQLLNVT